MFIDSNNINLLYSEQNNLLIITKPKIATSFLDNWFNTQTKEFEISPLGDIIYEKGEVDETLQKYINIWEDIKNKTFKGKVIVLFRNPLKRFLSAFCEDYINGLESYKKLTSKSGTISDAFFNHWFNENGLNVTDIEQFITWVNNDQLIDFPIGTLDKKYKDIFFKYIELHLKNLIQTSIYSGHNQQYLNIISQLFLLDYIDLEKGHILFDIDGNEDLQEYLIKNSIKKIGNKALNINSNKRYTKYVLEVLEINNLLEPITKFLGQENGIYSILKNKQKLAKSKI